MPKKQGHKLLNIACFLGILVLSLGTMAQEGTWTTTGSMASAHSHGSLTLLPGGKILVTGGLNNDNDASASAEIFDSATGTWSPTASMATERAGHTATLLPNGKVLVAGGGNFTDSGGTLIVLSSAEIYDPVSGTWSATGSLSTARAQHTATLLPGGRVLAAGGRTDEKNGLASAEIYDPATGTWIVTGSLSTARAVHAATLLPTGKVLVVGGISGWIQSAALASAELYDPATRIWSATGSMTTVRGWLPMATLLPNGKVLMEGGCIVDSTADCNKDLSSAELYDPSTGTWSLTGSMASARDTFPSALLPSGKVLVAGGDSNNGTLASAELYDPTTGIWNSAGDMTTVRKDPKAALLPSGKALMAGGVYGSDAPQLSSAELYDENPSCPAITLAPPSLPSGTLGTAYSQTITATGGTAPYTYTLMTNTLPPGLSLSSSGVISGTPTAGRTFPFTVMATDKNACPGGMPFSLSVTTHIRPVSDPW